MPFDLTARIAETRRRERRRFDCAMSLTYNRLRDEAPVDEGDLYASGRLGDRTTTPNSYGRDIVFGAEHASFTDTGTDAHKISVRTARVLTNGTEFFGTEVDHPGTEGTQWFTGNAQDFFHTALIECGNR